MNVSPDPRDQRRSASAIDGRRLPALRAIVGAGLVVASAVGVLLAYSSASRPPTTRFIVVNANLPAGHTLRARDLGAVALTLPTGASAVPAGKASTLLGRRTIGQLRRLDLLRPSDLSQVRSAAVRTGVEVPLEVDRSRTPGRALRSGAVVSVFATDPEGAGTVSVVASATVASVDNDDESVGAGPGVRVRLQIPDPATAATLIDAAVRSTITLVLPGTLNPTGGPR